MVAIGYMLLLLGLAAGFAGDLMFLNVAYRRNLAWFFGCLFLPLVAEIFLLTHWKASWRPYGLGLLGLAVAFLGAVIAGHPGWSVPP